MSLAAQLGLAQEALTEAVLDDATPEQLRVAVVQVLVDVSSLRGVAEALAEGTLESASTRTCTPSSDRSARLCPADNGRLGR